MIVHNNINQQETLYECARMHVYGVLYMVEVYGKQKRCTTFNATQSMHVHPTL
jgi:hypothetical protein